MAQFKTPLEQRGFENGLTCIEQRARPDMKYNASARQIQLFSSKNHFIHKEDLTNSPTFC